MCELSKATGRLAWDIENTSFYPPVNKLISDVMVSILSLASMGNYSLLAPTSSGYKRSCKRCFLFQFIIILIFFLTKISWCKLWMQHYCYIHLTVLLSQFQQSLWLNKPLNFHQRNLWEKLLSKQVSESCSNKFHPFSGENRWLW